MPIYRVEGSRSLLLVCGVIAVISLIMFTLSCLWIKRKRKKSKGYENRAFENDTLDLQIIPTNLGEPKLLNGTNVENYYVGFDILPDTLDLRRSSSQISETEATNDEQAEPQTVQVYHNDEGTARIRISSHIYDSVNFEVPPASPNSHESANGSLQMSNITTGEGKENTFAYNEAETSHSRESESQSIHDIPDYQNLQEPAYNKEILPGSDLWRAKTIQDLDLLEAGDDNMYQRTISTTEADLCDMDSDSTGSDKQEGFYEVFLDIDIPSDEDRSSKYNITDIVATESERKSSCILTEDDLPLESKLPIDKNELEEREGAEYAIITKSKVDTTLEHTLEEKPKIFQKSLQNDLGDDLEIHENDLYGASMEEAEIYSPSLDEEDPTVIIIENDLYDTTASISNLDENEGEEDAEDIYEAYAEDGNDSADKTATTHQPETLHSAVNKKTQIVENTLKSDHADIYKAKAEIEHSKIDYENEYEVYGGDQSSESDNAQDEDRDSDHSKDGEEVGGLAMTGVCTLQ